MFNRLSFILIPIIFLSYKSQSQNKGILPLTGIHYFNEGIRAKNIEVKVDGSFLLNNRLPLNKSFEVLLELPSGFTEDKTKMIFAAAELTIVSLNGTVLSNTANVLMDNAARGFPAAGFKELIVKAMLLPGQLKTDPGCIIKIRFYDLKSKNQLRLEFPVAIARPGEAMQISKMLNDFKTATTLKVKSSGVKIKNIIVSVDTTIRVSPKMAYASLDMSSIEGTSLPEVLSGKESFWVFDADLNEIKMTDRQLKQVNSAMENNMVNYLSKIPFRLKTLNNKSFTVRFRWESTDKRKIIDVVMQQ